MGLDGRHRGQGLVEYGMILVLVCLVCISALVLMGPQVVSILVSVNTTP